MIENEDKKDLVDLVGNPNFIKEFLGISGKINQISNQFPQSSVDIKYYQKMPGFQEQFKKVNQNLTNMIGSLVNFVQNENNFDQNQQLIKYNPLIDITDNLLENVDICLDKIKNFGQDKQMLEQIQKDNDQQQLNKKLENIEKPQYRFEDIIDNSDTPFIPKIKEKLHSLQELDQNIIRAQQNKDNFFSNFEKEDLIDFTFEHPYKTEIENLLYQDSQFETSDEVEVYRAFIEEDYIWVDCVEKLEGMIKHLGQQQVIAIDLEHHSLRSFQGITCLIQISSSSQDYLVDCLVPSVRKALWTLNQITTQGKIVKVLHGADSDILWLQRDFGIYIVNLFDTYQAAKELQLTNLSLKHLLDKYCRILTNKKLQLADWRIRPLKKEMIEYARQDTHYLLYIYEKVKGELKERETILKVLQQSGGTALQVYTKPVMKTKGYYFLLAKQKGILSQTKYRLLKALLRFRDQLARSDDECVTYVMNNQTLFQLVGLQLPLARQTLVARMNRLSPVLLNHIEDLLDVINASDKDQNHNNTHIYVKSDSKQLFTLDQMSRGQLKYLYNHDHKQVSMDLQEEVDEGEGVQMKVDGKYQGSQQFKPLFKDINNGLIKEIENGFNYKSETHFMKDIMPEIVDLFKTQEQIQKDKKNKKNEVEKEQETRDIQKEEVQREEFIQLHDMKNDGGRNTFVNPSGNAKQCEISREVVTDKRALDQVRKGKHEQERVSKEQMREIVQKFNSQKMEETKSRPDDPIDQLNKAYGLQNSFKKRSAPYKKSIFGGPRIKQNKKN